MSSRLRNPFRMRASEKIVSDSSFLGIYSPSILDQLVENDQNSKLWNNVTYIHSSPGGGKTSLLRIFEPTILNSLFSSQSHYKDIFTKLKTLNVFDENEVKVIGIYLLCSRSFEMLEDINIEPIQKKRLFYSLLNSRVILATLKNILTLKNKKFPDDLKSISFDYNDNNKYIHGLNTPCTGVELYSWAANFEEKIFTALDSLTPINNSIIPGHNELFAFSLMNPDNFQIDDKPICERFIFMLDDAHVLTKKQRSAIKDELIEKRGNFTLWISERIEVLDLADVLNERNIKDRDFQIINLEDFYRNKEAKTSLLFSTIADKRAMLSDSLNSFQDNLSTALNEEKYKDEFIKSINDTEVYFNYIQSVTSRFDYWIKYGLSQNSSREEKAILLKQIQILISRHLKKQQLTLDFGVSIEELTTQLGGEIKTTAIYFVYTNYKIPYYYGFSNLAKISSCNIEQFLSFSSELFERMLSNYLLGNIVTLTAEEQEKIIQEVTINKWKSLSSSIPYSKIVIKFLINLGALCKDETNQINAPYAPGVNGFGVKEGSKGLFKMTNWYEDENIEPLVNVITTCVAFNLLEVRTVIQGIKGQTWKVYYLNKWLCVYFRLPLSYGNWRPKSPSELFKWLK